MQRGTINPVGMKLVSFQSSPVPEDGCNLHSFYIQPSGVSQVSILTRPGGRVQPKRTRKARLE